MTTREYNKWYIDGFSYNPPHSRRLREPVFVGDAYTPVNEKPDLVSLNMAAPVYMDRFRYAWQPKDPQSQCCLYI